jgi:hypothetical protein
MIHLGKSRPHVEHGVAVERQVCDNGSDGS